MQLKKTALALGIALACPFFLAACDGDDGRNGRDGADGQAGSPGAAGSPGTPGAPGSNGANGLVEQTTLYAGNEQCFNGGVRLDSGTDLDGDGELAESEITATSYLCTPTQVNDSKNFNRIAAFPVCLQLDATCDVDDTTAAEIVAASEDGLTLIYSDSPMEQVGFVDITDPSKPSGLGVLALAGEPTSVAVRGDFALVGVNTSADFIDVSGALAVVDIASRSIVRSIDLGGQPDSVAVSPDGRYAAIAAAALVVDGGIYRHDFVAQAVIDGLMRASLDSGVPVLSISLTPHHYQDTDHHNAIYRAHFVEKGQEAARAALMIGQTRARLAA